jgi:hypothetical protein
MEGWKAGQVHGAFALEYDLRRFVATQASVWIKHIAVSTIILLFVIFFCAHCDQNGH